MTPPVIILDATPLGMVSNPKGAPITEECKRWLRKLLNQDRRVIIPGIADYEIRRELIRLGKQGSLQRLDNLRRQLEFLPVTQTALWRAAELWAHARRAGYATSDPRALDADVILAAQVLLLNEPDAVVATSNVGHLARLVSAARWQEIV